MLGRFLSPGCAWLERHAMRIRTSEIVMGEALLCSSSNPAHFCSPLLRMQERSKPDSCVLSVRVSGQDEARSIGVTRNKPSWLPIPPFASSPHSRDFSVVQLQIFSPWIVVVHALRVYNFAVFGGCWPPLQRARSRVERKHSFLAFVLAETSVFVWRRRP